MARAVAGYWSRCLALLGGRPPARPGSLASGASSRSLPLSAEGLDEILDGARRRAGLEHATCHELRHTCLTRLREAGMALEAVQAQAGHLSIESTRVYLHLANDWLAGEYRRAAELIDADAGAVAEMLAVQTVAVR